MITTQSERLGHSLPYFPCDPVIVSQSHQKKTSEHDQKRYIIHIYTHTLPPCMLISLRACLPTSIPLLTSSSTPPQPTTPISAPNCSRLRSGCSGPSQRCPTRVLASIRLLSRGTAHRLRRAPAGRYTRRPMQS